MDKKISQLTAASTPLTGTEEIAIVQSGVTKKATIEDVKGYKVYTALLTQSGGDAPTSISSGALTIGVTYCIVDPSGGDWTNVGAPNNNEGTCFVATGTTPNIWDGTLTYNTGAPVVTVLENTIGNIWFTYDSVGNYIINSNALFPVSKTFQFLNNILVEEGNLNISNSVDGSILYLASKNNGFDSINGYFNNTPIEIRVYN
jgi:hypothetical protein